MWCSGVTSLTLCSGAVMFTATAPGMWRGSTLRAVDERASRMMIRALSRIIALSSSAIYFFLAAFFAGLLAGFFAAAAAGA